jgi:hypothetical protein
MKTTDDDRETIVSRSTYRRVLPSVPALYHHNLKQHHKDFIAYIYITPCLESAKFLLSCVINVRFRHNQSNQLVSDLSNPLLVITTQFTATLF